jgi:Cysteine rich repeat
MGLRGGFARSRTPANGTLLPGRKASQMTRFVFALGLVLIAAGASAQGAREHDACTRDVSRFCRAHMGEGDQAVLACLQQNRAKLSKACQKVLTDHGQ